jgi:uncharacterized linocin/CFP29 family protein
MSEVMIKDAASLFNGMKMHPKPFIAEDGKAYSLVYNGRGDRGDINSYEQVPVENASLRYDEWRRLDDAVVRVAEYQLTGIKDLREQGLVYPLGNAMGTTVLTWETMSDMGEAITSIDPIRRGLSDAPDFETKHLPIPVTYMDYQIGERFLQESRNRGNPINTISAERAARKVNEALENMLFGATAVKTYGGGTIDTYLSFSHSNSVNLTEDWDAAGKTGAEIKDDVLAMVQESIDYKYLGPWMIYIPTAYQTKMGEDYSVSGSSKMTIQERIESIEGIIKVKVAHLLPANTVVMVQMTPDVVELVDGLPIQNVQWDTEGGFMHYFKVLTIQVPRLKADYNGNTGIVILKAAS